jgi:hypothetical protein
MKLLRKFRALFRRGKLDAEMSEEMTVATRQNHLTGGRRGSGEMQPI